MEGWLIYWYLFPASIVIATLAMSSGIGGAVFFSPLFILVLKLEPAVAVGAALMTELFGFSSGLYAYARAKLIDYKVGMNLLIFAVPLAVVGSLVGGRFPPDVLKAIFAVGIIFIGWQLYSSYRQEEKEKAEKIQKEEFKKDFESTLTDSEGNVYNYTVCQKGMGRFFAALGGFFVGIISVGLAELQEYQLVARCRVPARVAVATSIFVVVVTVAAASVGHIYAFATAAKPEILKQVASIVMFTAPGVVIGGQLGPLVQKSVNPDIMKVSIAAMFVVIGAVMLSTLAI